MCQRRREQAEHTEAVRARENPDTDDTEQQGTCAAPVVEKELEK